MKFISYLFSILFLVSFSFGSVEGASSQVQNSSNEITLKKHSHKLTKKQKPQKKRLAKKTNLARKYGIFSIVSTFLALPSAFVGITAIFYNIALLMGLGMAGFLIFMVLGLHFGTKSSDAATTKKQKRWSKIAGVFSAFTLLAAIVYGALLF